MVRRKRRNRTLVVLLLLLAASAVGYVVGVPLFQAVVAAPTPPTGFSVPLGEQMYFRLFELLLFAWLFIFGASIGSFLNVVIYRTPLGFSLLGSSRCPYCRAGIRPRDNIPVFGWLMLRGRCRVCRLPISTRYPLVEFTVGILILVLGTLEVLQAGANLPPAFGQVGRAANISWLIHHPNWDIVLACILHGILLCIVLSWALIQYDGHAVPRGYLTLAVVLVGAIPFTRPTVQAVPWISELPARLQEPLWLSQRLSLLIGLAAGLSIGLVLGGIERMFGRKPKRSETHYTGTHRVRERAVALGLVGIALGWQAVLSVALIATVVSLVGPRVAPNRLAKYGPSFLLYVGLATAAQVYLWGAIEQLPWWPNSQAGVVTIAVTSVATILLACLASLQDAAMNMHHHASEHPVASRPSEGV
jgi:leader peptidase (prepilin peptidase)/N-methyltransferase